MTCPHNELIETVDTTTTEQTGFGDEVVVRDRRYDVTIVCADCGEPVNPYCDE